MYSKSNDVIGFKYNGDVYYYIKNGQNDIIGILDSNYNEVVKYEYDSFGNILSINDGEGNNIINNSEHIGNINPYRYRSYYYDSETNLYYLNLRYYNPIWGRFINTDGILENNQSLSGHNLYAYCNNNPINLYDPNGQIGLVIGGLIILMAGSIMAGGVISATEQKAETGKVDFSQVAKDSLGGITIELGVGWGLSDSSSIGAGKLGGKVQVGGYQDFNYGLSNGEFYTATNSEIGVSASALDIELGRTYGYTHYRHPVTYENFTHNSPVTMFWDIYDCDHTVLYKGGSVKHGNKTYEKVNNEKFVGISYEKHILIGGHIKIGYTFDSIK